MIQSVLVGEQGVEGGADLDQAATGLVFAGQAIDLEAEDQADVAQGDLREQPGEIVAADGGGAGAALIAIEDADAFGGPAPLEGQLAELGLDLGGFAVALDLLGMRLADIDDRPAFQMVRLDLGETSGMRKFKRVHQSPPWDRRERRRGGGAGSSAPSGSGGVVGDWARVPASGVSVAERMWCELWTGGSRVSSWALAHGGQPSRERALLAPECQLQKRCHGDYRLGRGCDNSRGSTGRFRSASE